MTGTCLLQLFQDFTSSARAGGQLILRGQSLGACKDLCRATLDCQAVTFNEGTRDCFMHTTSGLPVAKYCITEYTSLKVVGENQRFSSLVSAPAARTLAKFVTIRLRHLLLPRDPPFPPHLLRPPDRLRSPLPWECLQSLVWLYNTLKSVSK